MSIIDTSATGRGLLTRVRNLLLRPKVEWPVIEAEPANVRDLFLRYACILALIPAVARVIGLIVFGAGVPGIAVFRPALSLILIGGVLSYLASLVIVAVVALVIDALAPSFGAERNRDAAFKVAVYAWTAAWVAGLFNLFPALAILGSLLSLYGIYLLYLGLPRLMKAPEDRAGSYTAVVVVIAIVLTLIIGSIVAAISMASYGVAALSAANNGHAPAAGTVTIGGTNIDLGKMQQAAEQMQGAVGPGGEPVTAVAPEALKSLLPSTLGGGFTRAEVEASSAAAGGYGGSSAEGRYEKDGAAIRLTVTDMAAAGAIAAIGGALGVESSRETATSYEKVGTVNGRMTTERYDRETRAGEYMVMLDQRFSVSAEGEQVEMSQLKAAVASVDAARLQALAKG